MSKQSQIYAEYLQEANNPATRPERLQAIFDDVRNRADLWEPDAHAKSVFSAVASHPNTPPEVLAAVFEFAPDAVLQNPVFPLLPLNYPEFGRNITCGAAATALRSPECLPSFIAMLAANPPEDWNGYVDPSPGIIALEARMHIGLAGEIPTAEWLTTLRSFWREYASTLQGEEQAAVAELVDYALLPPDIVPAEPDPFAREDASFIQATLAEPTGDLRILVDRARNPESPTQWLQRYADDIRWWVHLAVATNPATQPEVLMQLVHQIQTHPVFRRALARHPRADASVLIALIADQNNDRKTSGYPRAEPSVRRLIACHPAANQEVKAKVRNAVLNTYNPLIQFVALKTQDDAKKNYDYELKNHTLPLLGFFGRLTAAVLLPPPLQQDLAQDSNRLVRAAAQARLRGEVFTWENDV